jgi:DNA-binding transcriptional MerR regulator
MTDELLTVSKAAEKLDVSARTVQRYCKQGLLNYKWVHGKRHRELRIVPPIPLSLLPGVRRGSAPGLENMVSREEFDLLRESLAREIQELNRRLDVLEREISGFPHGGKSGAPVLSETASLISQRLDRIETLLTEYERVRPVEKRLILKLARTAKEQGDFLSTMGMKENAEQTG